MDVLNESIATGGDPNVSDAYTINGEPGDLYNCSAGIKSKQTNDSIISLQDYLCFWVFIYLNMELI